MTHLEKKEIKGRVENLIEISSKIIRNPDGSFSKGETLVSDNKSYNFNQAGYLIEEIEDGEKRIFEYYENNNVKRIKRFSKDGKLEFENEYKNINDKNARLEYKHDERGNIIAQIHYNKDGAIDFKLTWQYNSEGRKSEFSYFNSDGSLNYRYHYEYKYDNGNLIQMIEYYFNDEPGFTEPIRQNKGVYHFDPITGNWNEMEKYEVSYIGHNKKGNPLYSSIPKTHVTRLYDYY